MSTDLNLYITFDDYYRIRKQISDEITNQLNIPIDFVNSNILGKTIYDKNTYHALRIEIQDNFEISDTYIMKNKNYDNDVEYILDFAFLEKINAIFHEYSHAEQSLKMWNRETKRSQEIALAFVSFDFKEFVEKYHYCLANEVDAEMAGLMRTYYFLKNNFSNQADEVMLNFVNEMCKNSTYILSIFRDNKYNDINKLISDINNCYNWLRSLKVNDRLNLELLTNVENKNFQKISNIFDKTLYLAHLSFEKELSNKNNFPCLKHRNIKREISQLHLDKLPIPDFGYDICDDKSNEEFN